MCDYIHFYLSKGRENDDQPCTFPEVFLTLGAPGDKFVIPLSPVPGRSLFLNLNLVPKEDVTSCTSPKNVYSEASSNPAVNNITHPVSSYPHEQEKQLTSPISPDEDYFSLIEKVHTAQLQKVMAKGRQKWKRDCGKGREKGNQGKGKGDGQKDKKDGGK